MTIRNEVLKTNTENGLDFERQQKDIEEIVSGYDTSIRYTVNGFWSWDPITIYVRRDFFREDTDIKHRWKIELSWSSGGRDKSTVPSDVEATKNFAAALADAAQYADDLSNRQAEFEAAYIVYREKEEKKRLEEEARKKAAFEADPEMGMEKAKEILDNLTQNKEILSLVVKQRGSLLNTVYDLSRTPTGRIRIVSAGRPMTKEQFLNEISKLSKTYVMY